MTDPSLAQTTFANLGNFVLLAQDDPFIGSPLFFVIMVVILLGLGGLLYYLRTKRDDD